MSKLKSITIGAVAIAAIAGGAAIIDEPTPEDLASEQIAALEELIDKRLAAGESTTMQVQKIAEIEARLNP